MRLNLKALGLALVAALAMSAVAAASASAQEGEFTSESGEAVTVVGADSGKNSFTAFGNTVECPNSTYTGHKVLTQQETAEGKTHQALPHQSTEVTVTPHYRQTQPNGTANCNVTTGGNLFSATVAMNGCDYKFYDFTTTPAEAVGTYGFKTDVVCPSGNQIEVHVFESHAHLTEVCNVKVGPQTGLTGAHATDTGDGTIHINGTIPKIKASKSGICGAANEENATYTVNVTTSGAEEGISISH